MRTLCISVTIPNLRLWMMSAHGAPAPEVSAWVHLVRHRFCLETRHRLRRRCFTCITPELLRQVSRPARRYPQPAQISYSRPLLSCGLDTFGDGALTRHQAAGGVRGKITHISRTSGKHVFTTTKSSSYVKLIRQSRVLAQCFEQEAPDRPGGRC